MWRLNFWRQGPDKDKNMGETIRLGLLRLCDAAPVILADQEAMYAAAGLRVELSVEPSWANIADKLSYGLLEGAVMLPPLAMACMEGLRGRQTRLVVPMSLSANGNAITLSTACAGAFAAGGIAGLARQKRLRLAVVHGFSSHDLLLRHWLAAHDVGEVDITIVPPAEMVASLQAGAIDGFCAGAPWGLLAARLGVGFNAVYSKDIWPGHPEKCLALREDFAVADPARLTALLRVLLAASAQCALAERRAGLAEMLAQPEYLDLPAALLAQALDPAAGGPVFGACYPAVPQALWYARQMRRWGRAPAGILDVPGQLYRPDLFALAGGEVPETIPAALDEVVRS